ncbi:MAG: CHASE domain-containing protein [Rubrobacter sp.]
MRRERRAAFDDLRRRFMLHARFGAVAYAVLAISLIFTALSYLYARQSIEAEVGVRFQETVLVSEQSLERRTNSYLDAMVSSRAFLAVSGDVGTEEWETYISGLDFQDRYQGLQALGYARYLPSSGSRDVSTTVEFVGPSNLASKNLLGYDFYTEGLHRAAMQAARDTGEPQATSRDYVYVQNRNSGGPSLALRPGFFVYVPVYEAGPEPETPAERRAAIRGFVFGAFGMEGLLAEIIPERAAPHIDFEVYDGLQASPRNLLYDADGVLRAADGDFDPRYSESSGINVAGRDWSVYFASLPGFSPSGRQSLPNFALATGLLVTLALFAATWMLSTSREKAEEATRKLEDANRKLEIANKELESFSYSVSHDLRAPLRSIDGFSQILTEDYSETLGAEGVAYLGRVRSASNRMGELIDDLLLLSRVIRAPLNRAEVNPTAVAREVAAEIQRRDPDRPVNWKILDTPAVSCDQSLLKAVLENLLGNAWKFTEKQDRPTIEFGYSAEKDRRAYYVRDDGAGFDPRYVDKLFGAFQRLHTTEEFEGTGIGLATVARIVRRHGGEVSAEGAVGEGATFCFTLEPPGGPPRIPKEASRKAALAEEAER